MSPPVNRTVQYLAGLCAAFAFTFTGSTLAWSSPAIPKFKNGDANVDITDIQTSWVVALHNAGALLGCYIGQVLNERVGRRRTFFASTVPALIGAVTMMLTRMPELMYVARTLMGLATGIIAVVTMIYVTEISDKEIRGSLGTLVSVMNNVGALTIYSLGPFVSYMSLNGIILALPIIFLVLCSWVPESPYFYLKEGKLELAKKEFMRLRQNTDENWVEQQMSEMRAHVKESMENKTTFKELITNLKYRRAVYIVTGLKLLQYMTGILVIQSYLEVIFRQTSSISGPYASIIYGMVQLASGISATFVTRWCGRRILLLVSCTGVSVAMTLVGLYFLLKDTLHVTPETLASVAWMPLVGMLGFNVTYSFGVGSLPYVLQAELFPVNVKAVASSSATMLACILGFIVTKCYQGVKDSFGHYTVFWSFALLGYVGIFFIYFFVPETKGKSLEEVQDSIQDKSPEFKTHIEEEEALNTGRDEEVGLKKIIE